MSNPQPGGPVKPMFVITPGTMRPQDIKRAEKLCGICIVECTDPASMRLMEPPLNADVSAQARAALRVMRWMVTQTAGNAASRTFYSADLIRYFADILLSGDEPKRVEPVKKVGT